MLQSQGHENNSAFNDRYLDLQKLSEYSSLAVPTLRDYIKRGTLPHYKLLGKIVIKKSEFDGWMEQFKVDKTDELESLVEDAIASLKH